MRAELLLEKVRYDFPEDGKIVIGLSGGADSVLLTYLLLLRYGAQRLHAVHVNHGIRGEEADRDEEFVRTFCSFHNLQLSVLKKDIPATSKVTGEGTEECARRVRYEVFSEIAGESGCIATAHNADDHTETVLMNIVRGTGPRGACGIPVQRDNIYRPLLFVSRAEVEFLCEYFGLSFVVDSTNLTTEYTRNRLRHLVIPELKSVNPQLTEAVSRFTQTLSLQNDFMQKEAEKLLKDAETEWGWALSVLRAAHPAVLRAALECLLHSLGRMSYEHISVAEQCALFGGSVSLPGHVQLTAAQDMLTVTTDEANPVYAELKNGCAHLPDGRILTVFKKFTENEKNSGKVHNLLFNNVSDCDKIASTAVVRTRRGGDRFRPSKRGVSKSLKKLFNELRIPEAVRDRLLLLEVNGEILWIESVGAAEGAEELCVQIAVQNEV